jgi:hypothetical protein
MHKYSYAGNRGQEFPDKTNVLPHCLQRNSLQHNQKLLAFTLNTLNMVTPKRYMNLKEDREECHGTSRFQFIDEDSVVNDKIAGRVPRNTVKNNRWAVNIWDTWAEARNNRQTNPNFPRPIKTGRTIPPPHIVLFETART